MRAVSVSFLISLSKSFRIRFGKNASRVNLTPATAFLDSFVYLCVILCLRKSCCKLCEVSAAQQFDLGIFPITVRHHTVIQLYWKKSAVLREFAFGKMTVYVKISKNIVIFCTICLVFYWLCWQLTVSQRKEFLAELHRFKEKFRLHGPGSVGTNLDKGLFVLSFFVLWSGTQNEHGEY